MKLSRTLVASNSAPVAVYRPKAERLMGPLQPEWTGDVWEVTSARIYDVDSATPHRVPATSYWSAREDAEAEASRCRVVDEDDAPHAAVAVVVQVRPVPTPTAASILRQIVALYGLARVTVEEHEDGTATLRGTMTERQYRASGTAASHCDLRHAETSDGDHDARWVLVDESAAEMDDDVTGHTRYALSRSPEARFPFRVGGAMARPEADYEAGRGMFWDCVEYSTTVTGHDAIVHAERTGAPLYKHADPVEGARVGLTVEEARAIAAEDPSLIWTTV